MPGGDSRQGRPPQHLVAVDLERLALTMRARIGSSSLRADQQQIALPRGRVSAADTASNVAIKRAGAGTHVADDHRGKQVNGLSLLVGHDRDDLGFGERQGERPLRRSSLSRLPVHAPHTATLHRTLRVSDTVAWCSRRIDSR